MADRTQIAITLYNVREELKKDFEQTVRSLRDMGYPGVQLSGFDVKAVSASRVRSLLDELELSVAGAHVGWNQLESDMDGIIQYAREVENTYVMCSSLPEAYRATREAYEAAARQLTEFGRKLRDAGIVFGYHNHAFEYETFDGRTGMDILLEDSDPNCVTWEPDVYWIARAGRDPKEELKKAANRSPLVHIKDMTGDGEAFFAEIGSGVLDFASIFAQERSLGAQWFIVEQDQSRIGALESARVSLENLRKMGRV